MDPNIITLLSINDQQSHRLCISVFTIIMEPNITTLLSINDQQSHRLCISVFTIIMDPNITTLLSINDQQSHRLCISVFTIIMGPNITTLSLSLLISLSLGETLLLEPFDGKVYDLLPVFLPELWSCPSNHLCLAPIFWLVFLSLSFRLS